MFNWIYNLYYTSIYVIIIIYYYYLKKCVLFKQVTLDGQFIIELEIIIYRY